MIDSMIKVFDRVMSKIAFWNDPKSKNSSQVNIVIRRRHHFRLFTHFTVMTSIFDLQNVWFWWTMPLIMIDVKHLSLNSLEPSSWILRLKQNLKMFLLFLQIQLKLPQIRGDKLGHWVLSEICVKLNNLVCVY